MFLSPPCHGVSHHEKSTTFRFCGFFFSSPKQRGARGMGKRAGNTNTGEGVQGKTVRTTSDDAGGKFVSEKSMSTV